MLARTDTNDTTFYHADGNGNITALTDTNANIVARCEYDAFGRLIAQSGSLAAANVYRFSSKEYDSVTGLYYFGYRFYDPTLQRWLNRDPIQEAGGINLYGFVGNNPINRIDPYGLAWYNPWSWGLWDSIANQVYPQPSTTVATPAPADPEDNVGNNTTAFSIQPPGVMQQAANESTQVGMAVPNGILNTAAMMLGPGEAEGAYAAADEALQAERAAATASKAAKAAEKCEKHHLLPRQFANNFKKVGLNPDDYTMDLPAAQHRLTPDGIHTGPAADSWNGQWSQFFQNNPNYTQQDVLNQLSSMQQQFGLK
jgi:RHS repeat-associated protein